MTWHTTPEARALLADCAADAPAFISHRRDYAMTSDEWLSYDETDPRVARLADIQRDVMRRAAAWSPAWKACGMIALERFILRHRPEPMRARERAERDAEWAAMMADTKAKIGALQEALRHD